jgi:hypothetical protein
MTQRRDWKELVSEIVEYLHFEDEDSTRLWDVLSALRGPDCSYETMQENAIYASGDVRLAEDTRMNELKKATTAVIRHAIGMRINQGLVVRKDTPKFSELRRNLTGYTHFVSHLQRAFEALGLDWWETNGDGEPEPVSETTIRLRTVDAAHAIA